MRLSVGLKVLSRVVAVAIALPACGMIVGVKDELIVVDAGGATIEPEEVVKDGGISDADLDALKLDYETDAPEEPPVDAGCPVKKVGPLAPTFGDRSESDVSVMQFQDLGGLKTPDDNAETRLPALVSFPNHPAPSELLTLSQFKANVPETAKVITGLELELVGGANRAEFFFDAEIRAVQLNTNASSLNRGVDAAWPEGDRGTFTTRKYGRDTDRWELPLTRELVNSDDLAFAIRFKKKSGDNAPTFKLDAVKLTVFYCE